MTGSDPDGRPESTKARFRIGVDVGGTFTDVCVYERGAGKIAACKAGTTADPAIGLRAGLQVAAGELGLRVGELLSATGELIYGTTIATNAVIMERTARVGLLCTAGFRDVLLIREGGKPDGFNYRLDYPPPYVPRRLILAVRERISPEGDVLCPLEDEDVAAAIATLRAADVGAVAVAYLWSFVNPAHELRTGQLIGELWPGVPCVLSHALNPAIREYRRTIATVIDASLQPLVGRHLRSVEGLLRAEGFSGELFVASSAGGVMSVDEMVEKPIYTIGSGPTLAPAAGRFAASAAGIAATDLIVVDMGGTSFDMSVIRSGRPVVSRETRIGSDLVGMPMVDIRSIGAGGGSIAWVDAGGLLHVGPKSAGAEPGPACYAKGGVRSTVTDANLLLGYLDPTGLAGGRVPLSLALASNALQVLADSLVTDAVTAAHAVIETANQGMAAGIESATLRDGIDPAEAVLVAGGGAVGCHVAAIAKELGIPRILLPGYGGILSAFGTLASDIEHEYGHACYFRSDAPDLSHLESVLSGLRDRAERFLASSGRPRDNWQVTGICEARYVSQIWELDVPMSGLVVSETELAALVTTFHQVHERVYGIAQPGQPVEFLHWRIRATATTARPEVKPSSRAQRPAASDRAVYFGKFGWVKTPIFDIAMGPVPPRVQGPSVIQELLTTIVVPPQWRLETSGGGGFWLIADSGTPESGGVEHHA